jgi:hypothetical protein
MKEYLQKSVKKWWGESWYLWIGIILEVLGQKLIGREAPIYPFFTTGVVAVFELYVLLKLPYSENLWLYEESPNNPKCTQIRWIGLIPILAVSYFTRTPLWYFWFYISLSETITLFFAGTEETKNKMRADGFRNVRSSIITVIIIAVILTAYAYNHSKYMQTMMNSISANTSYRHPASLSH